MVWGVGCGQTEQTVDHPYPNCRKRRNEREELLSVSVQVKWWNKMATSTCGKLVSQSSSEQASGKTATYIFSYCGGRGSRRSG